jgi:hypothetical protein
MVSTDRFRRAVLAIASSAVIILLIAAGGGAVMNPPGRLQNSGPFTNRFLIALESCGYTYMRLSDNTWEVPFTGKNIKHFTVRVTLNPETAAFVARIADRKFVRIAEPLLQKLLELNDTTGAAKFSLSKEALYVSAETQARLVDGDHLRHLLDQVSTAVDDSFPSLRPYLTGDAKKQ